MPKNERDIKKEWEEAYKVAVQYWWQYWEEAKKDLEFYLGEQWRAADKLYLANQRREAYVFNKVRRVVHMITGYQRKHRLALTVEPIEGSDELTANQLTATLMWIMQYCNGMSVMSDCFANGAVKTGLNLLALYLDYSEDPVNGDIRFRRMPYNSFLLDPNTSERDLSDCGWITHRKYLSRDVIKCLLPGRAKDIDQLRKAGRDNKYTHLPVRQDLYGDHLLPFDEFWVRRAKKVKVLIDKNTGDMRRWSGPQNRLDFLLSQHPNIAVAESWRNTVEFNILVNGEIMYSGPDPWGLEDFPFVPVWGYWDPEYDRSWLKLQGVIRCMRDPQSELNKRRSKVIDIIDSQIMSGWKAKEGKVVNPESLYQTGQGQVVWMQDDAQLSDAEKIQPADIPPGLFQLMEVMDKDIMEIPGANSELFGMAENEDTEIAGVLAKMRQGAGLTVLQDLFDNYRLSKKLLGQKMITLIQKNFSPLKVKRIINEQPAPEFYRPSFGKYDAIPEEGVLTDTQRQMHYAQLLMLRKEGAPIPWTAIFDAAPIQGKRKLQEMIAQAEESQQQQLQIDLRDKKLVQEMMQAKIFSDLANAEGKRSKARADEGKAVLDRVKAAQEIAQMKDDRFFKMYDFVDRVSTPQERRQIRNQAMVRR